MELLDYEWRICQFNVLAIDALFKPPSIIHSYVRRRKGRCRWSDLDESAGNRERGQICGTASAADYGESGTTAHPKFHFIPFAFLSLCLMAQFVSETLTSLFVCVSVCLCVFVLTCLVRRFRWDAHRKAPSNRLTALPAIIREEGIELPAPKIE